MEEEEEEEKEEEEEEDRHFIQDFFPSLIPRDIIVR